MSDRTPSWKDRLNKTPKGSFIGRTVQLQQFRSTVATPLEQRETLTTQGAISERFIEVNRGNLLNYVQLTD